MVVQPLSHGGAAVDVFFILSGLVIVRSLESFRCQPLPFLIARAARTFPVYLVMFALALAVQPVPAGFERMTWIGPDSPAHGIWSEGWPHAWLAETVAHLTMTHGLIPNGLLPDAWVSFLGAAWSLSTEWQFYLLALLFGCAGMRTRGMAIALLGLAVAGLAWRLSMSDGWQFSRAFLPNKAHYFALGVASAVLVKVQAAKPPSHDAGLDRDVRKQGRSRVRCGSTLSCSPTLFLLTLGATLTLGALQGGVDKLLPPLVWTLCLAAQLAPHLPGTRLLAALLRTRFMLWLGAISYCVYLANEPVQKLLGFSLGWLTRGEATLFTAIWLPAAFLLPLGAAACLHRWVEAPALRHGRTLAHNQTTPAGEPNHAH